MNEWHNFPCKWLLVWTIIQILSLLSVLNGKSEFERCSVSIHDSVSAWPGDSAPHCVSGAFTCQCNWGAWWACFSRWACFKASCKVLGGLRHCSSWAVHQRDRLSPSVWRLPATSKVLMWTHFAFERCRSSLYLRPCAHFISICYPPLCDLASGSRLWQVYPSLGQLHGKKRGMCG